MSKERNKAVPAVYVILRHDGKVLLMERKNTGYYDGHYSLCAGHVDAGELPIPGMIREAKEELGITFDPKDLKLVHAMYREKHDDTGDRMDFFFETEHWSGEIENKEPHKCGHIGWFASNELPKNIMSHVKFALECVQKGIMYSELSAKDIKNLSA